MVPPLYLHPVIVLNVWSYRSGVLALWIGDKEKAFVSPANFRNRAELNCFAIKVRAITCLE